jgi:hypothetical protein
MIFYILLFKMLIIVLLYPFVHLTTSGTNVKLVINNHHYFKLHNHIKLNVGQTLYLF